MHGEYKIPGGKLVVVDLERHEGRLRQVRVSGDFFLEPDTALADINAALEGLSADSEQAALTQAITDRLAGNVDMYGITPEGVAVAVRRALDAEVGA